MLQSRDWRTHRPTDNDEQRGTAGTTSRYTDPQEERKG